MTDSSLPSESQPAESLPRAHCSACGATFRVRDADRTYRCRHCGGEVRAAQERGRAAPDHLASAEARDHELRVRGLARDREERQQFARERRNGEIVFKLIAGLLVVDLLVLAPVTLVVVHSMVSEFVSGQLDAWRNPTRPAIASAVIAALLVLTVLMLRRLRRAPVGIAIAVAVLHTLPALFDAEKHALVFIYAPASATWTIVAMVLRLLLASAHCFAADWLSVRAARSLGARG